MQRPIAVQIIEEKPVAELNESGQAQISYAELIERNRLAAIAAVALDEIEPITSSIPSAPVRLICDKGHPIRRSKAEESRGRLTSSSRACNHCKVEFNENDSASYICDQGCDYYCCVDCYVKRRPPT